MPAAVLRDGLIEIVKSRRAFAFVGSGASVEAGAPTWPGLIDRVLVSLDRTVADAIQGQRVFERAFQERYYPQCFSCIEATVGRNLLEESVRAAFSALAPQTQAISKLADWPFDGYITTNYDELLFDAVQQASRSPWIKVGNSDDECRLVSGDARKSSRASTPGSATSSSIARSSTPSSRPGSYFDWCDVYNNFRPHSSLGYLAPAMFAALLLGKLPSPELQTR